MSVPRAVARLAVLVPFTLVVCAGNFVLLPLGIGSPARGARIRSAFLRAWARGTLRILGVRVHAEGSPPEPPFFFVSNHLGYLDVAVLASRMRCCFVAKSETARWPIVGLLIRQMGTIFVDRGHVGGLGGVVDRMVEAVRVGHGVTFFPEGTSSDGARVLRFKASLFEAAARTHYPVSCGSVWYGTPAGQPPAGLSVCWWGDMTLGGHFWKLLQIPRVRAAVTFDDCPVRGADRKQLADAAFSAVRRRFLAVTPEGARSA